MHDQADGSLYIYIYMGRYILEYLLNFLSTNLIEKKEEKKVQQDLELFSLFKIVFFFGTVGLIITKVT